MKKISFVILMVFVASIFLMAAAPATNTLPLARLTVINKTGETVNIGLDSVVVGDNTVYYLTSEGYDYNESIWTVERDVYNRTTWACGASRKGTLDITTNVRLTFPSCYNQAMYMADGPWANQGEPTMEKVHLKSSPWGVWYRYQH